MRRKALKKIRAAHSLFQRLTTHPCEIFLISKITSWLSSISHTSTNTTFFQKPPTTFLSHPGGAERQGCAKEKKQNKR